MSTLFGRSVDEQAQKRSRDKARLSDLAQQVADLSITADQLRIRAGMQAQRSVPESDTTPAPSSSTQKVVDAAARAAADAALVNALNDQIAALEEMKKGRTSLQIAALDKRIQALVDKIAKEPKPKKAPASTAPVAKTSVGQAARAALQSVQSTLETARDHVTGYSPPDNATAQMLMDIDLMSARVTQLRRELEEVLRG
jgi:hypothetical protein